MKKIIQRNLPLNETYHLLSIHRTGIENAVGFCCENCGKQLANHAILATAKKRSIIVGLDCMKTLTMQNKADVEIEIYSFNCCLRFSQLPNATFTVDEDKFRVFGEYTDNKGKNQTKVEYYETLKTFGFLPALGLS
jgi:hypothetical protein